ncbi:MAG: BPTI/Kunitz domain-containing protein [Myxococcales bacterium]
MPRFSSVARVGMFASFAVVLASACGGQSFTKGDGGDAGSGATSNGGSGEGGSTSHAGTTSTAGKGHAGTGAGGGSAGSNVGGSGSAGAGGAVSEECGAPPVSGSCAAFIPVWYNDPTTGICRPFVYGGCGGNANRYPTLEACQQACPGGSPNYDSCKLPSDCLVTGTGCCGICDSPDISAHDLIAYNKQYAGLLQCGLALDVAAGGAASAGAAAPVACAPCPPPQGPGTLQYFVPDCVAGQCVVTDVRTSDVTACKTSDECKLRHGTGCCEGCGTTDVISVRNDGSFEKLVCSGAPVPCPACIPGPTDAVPYCGADGHCAVAIPLQAGAAQ